MANNRETIIPGYSPSKAAFAKYLVRSLVVKDIEKTPLATLPEEIVSHKPPTDGSLPRRSEQSGTNPAESLTVGIIGAGIAGLYSALILKSLGIKYEILEANPDRIGGRLFTHYFTEPKDGTHDYYDIGAMRFPKTPIMERTFDLFDRTDTKLGKYEMSCPQQPMRYNDITKVLPSGDDKWKGDPFKVSTANHGPVPPDSVADPDVIMNDAFFPYRRKIKRALNACIKHADTEPKKDGKPNRSDPAWPAWSEKAKKLDENLERAWQYLMQHDKFSLRDYLTFVEGQDTETIAWLECLNSATGWFDQAFSENILESLAFEYTSQHDEIDNPDVNISGEDVDWKYIQDGTYKLTNNTLSLLQSSPGPEGSLELGKQVTSMKLVPSPDKKGQKAIAVSIADEPKPRHYDSVINTTTFGALQKMDLSGLSLPYAMKTAIRSLRYDSSTKVGIKFDNAWWIKAPTVKGGLGNIRGGLGKTDMPLRTCVYPSYNLDDDHDKPAVLLCSYSWGSDSERIASMVNPVPSTDPTAMTNETPNNSAQPEREVLLKETMIDNLARLHSTDEQSYVDMKALISKSYITHYGYDWTKDPYTCGGAFALYSPSQFRTLYPNIVRPAADSRLHVVGEAASAHHAWIVGALDSAARGVYLLLERFKLFKEQEKLVDEWGGVGEVDEKTAHLQVALGMLDRSEQPRANAEAV